MAKDNTKTVKKKHTKGMKKRMENLVQYSKDTDKKPKKKADKQEDIVIEAEVMDVGAMSIALPTLGELPSNSIPATVTAILNKSELKLYIKEVTEWYTSHPDWNAKEDLDDINGIAMEKVIQYRLLLSKKRRSTTDIEKDYGASVQRMQTFRQNLAARRVDRINKGKHGSGGQTNIAIIAGGLDEQSMQALIMRNGSEEDEEDSLFPKIS